MDLVELPRDEWPKMQAACRKYWPHTVKGYCLLDIQLQHPDINQAFKFKVFCPGGDVNNGMVAISDSPHYYQVMVCPVSKDTSAIEAALVNTSVIDWNREVWAPAVNRETFDCLKRVGEQLSLRIVEDPACEHLLDKDSKLLEITNPPPNTYVGPLKLEFLDLVDRTWTFYNPGHSREYFKTLATNGLVFVLYSSEDNRPMCWMAVDETGAFAHMYCMGVHRRNGYAEYLTKVVTNHMLKQGNHVLAYTLLKNMKPQNLFQKLGFENLGVVNWLAITKATKE